MASMRGWALGLLAVTAMVCSIASGEVLNLGDNDFDDFVAKLPEEALLLVDFYTVRRETHMLVDVSGLTVDCGV